MGLRLPVNQCRNPYHTPEIDAEVIREFCARFPTLQFLEFYRNPTAGFGGGGCLHVIKFAGLPAELIRTGAIDESLILREGEDYRNTGFARGEADVRMWVFHDRRRRAKWTVSIWIQDGSSIPALAWFEPSRWTKQRAAGRFQRLASWTTNGNVISPDWNAIRGGVAP